jgi:hypothetical protein
MKQSGMNWTVRGANNIIALWLFLSVEKESLWSALRLRYVG